MKVILDMSPRALKALKNKAKAINRSRKNYMEIVLGIHAAMEEPSVPTPSTIKSHDLTNNKK